MPTRMKNDFYSRGKSISDLKAHLILTTKYKKKILTEEMRKRLHEIIEDLLWLWECRLIEINGENNYIYILFQYHPTTELSKLIGNIKSISSRRLRKEFPEQINKVFYQRDVFWSEFYFISSCGSSSISTLKNYIKNVQN